MERGMALHILESKEQRYYDSLINLCIAGDLDDKARANHEMRICEEDLRNWTEKMLKA